MMEADLDGQTLNLGGYEEALRARMERLEQANFGPRLWQKDGSLWKKDARSQEMIPNALGWLTVAEQMEKQLDDLGKFAAEVRDSGFRHVVHMGMGGSSLAPMTFKQVLLPSSLSSSGGLTLSILDTTDPATIRKIENEVPLQETLFIVASKSGTTIEPTTFGEYFYAKVKAQKGIRAGENFVAITDPGSPLVRLANERAFRRVFLSPVDIGGRFSALSPFGLVPAALAGIRVDDLLSRARQMIRACGPDRPIAENPGILLGAVMGELGLQGRDKITFLLPDSISTLGLWLEQLIAE
ncbi:MAG: transaldolase, partial [Deltaproteobacteria bacterium]|nr:transaldolase [Deltaproteobacteria bacterium]